MSPVVETLNDFDPYDKVGVKYKFPSYDLIAKTHKLLDYYDSNTDHYIALALALHFGLRRKEILNAKRSWFTKVNSQIKIAFFTDETFRVKSGEDGYAFGSSVIGEKILSMFRWL